MSNPCIIGADKVSKWKRLPLSRVYPRHYKTKRAGELDIAVMSAKYPAHTDSESVTEGEEEEAQDATQELGEDETKTDGFSMITSSEVS